MSYTHPRQFSFGQYQHSSADSCHDYYDVTLKQGMAGFAAGTKFEACAVRGDGAIHARKQGQIYSLGQYAGAGGAKPLAYSPRRPASPRAYSAGAYSPRAYSAGAYSPRTYRAGGAKPLGITAGASGLTAGAGGSKPLVSYGDEDYLMAGASGLTAGGAYPEDAQRKFNIRMMQQQEAMTPVKANAIRTKYNSNTYSCGGSPRSSYACGCSGKKKY